MSPGRRAGRSQGPVSLAAVVLVPLTIFALHGSLFSDWQIDDAGISYAYARNLAAGEGLVAQPGAEPVEGFTNLLWVVLLALLMPVVDQPGVAARLLSHGFVLAAFATLALGARRWFADRWRPIAAVGLSTTALVTGFPAWTLSGLENGLYVFLVALFVASTTMTRDHPGAGVAVGGVWLLMIATRPEAAPLLVVPVVRWAAGRDERRLRPFTLTAAGGLLALTVFRVLYFGDVVPNTYYAKSAPGWKLLAGVTWTPGRGLLFALAGTLALGIVVRLTAALVARAAWLRGRSREQLDLLALWLTLFVSYLVFETLPSDWMPEGRFATALFLLAPLAVLGLVRRHPARLAGVSAALIVLAGGYALVRTPAFVRSPPAPFASVLELADRLAATGEALGTGPATRVLLPDIGGALWRDRFEVVDLAGLIDRRIARTLRAEDHQAFPDLVLERRRPELIWTHGYWRSAANLEGDPRLERDYLRLLDDGTHALYVRRAAAAAVAPDRLLAAFSAGGPASDSG